MKPKSSPITYRFKLQQSVRITHLLVEIGRAVGRMFTRRKSIALSRQCRKCGYIFIFYRTPVFDLFDNRLGHDV